MRPAVAPNQQPQAGAPPNQVAQSGQGPPQGSILRLSNPGANPQLRSLLLSQQQPVRIGRVAEAAVARRRSFPVCVFSRAACLTCRA